MSNTEDYLDGLLNSVEGRQKRKPVPEFAEGQETVHEAADRDAEQEFLDAFEQEFLTGEDTDAFMRQFERELDADAGDEMFDNIDALVQDSPEEVTAHAKKVPEAEDDGDFMVNTLDEDAADAGEDFTLGMEFGAMDDADEPLPGLADMEAPEPEESSAGPDDSDLMDLLQADGDFSGIGDLFDVEETKEAEKAAFMGMADGVALEEIPLDDSMIREEEEQTQTDEAESGKKGSAAAGFWKKMSHLFFGEEEKEDALTEEKEAAEQQQEMVAKAAVDRGNYSEEEFNVLQELEGSGQQEPAEEPEATETKEEVKERKKREKEEKKVQKKAEKAEKKAQKKAERTEKKARKERKPKLPKEPDRTPPLPKKPVVLSFVLTGSFLALVLLGMNFFGYSSDMENAQKEFGMGNYTKAYALVSGVAIKEQDEAFYQKYRVMGTVSGEYDAYQTFMEAGLYDMALDSLVRTVGRCQKYQPDAEAYGCVGELARLHEQAAGALGSFGITEERALELYALEERTEYSVALNEILEQAGYAVDQME